MVNQQFTNSKAFNDLRSLLPSVFQGPNFNAVLAGLAEGDQFNQNNATAVFQNSFILTAAGTSLDVLLGSRGFSRPDLYGISDDSYRNLWIKGYNFANKVEGIENILSIGYLPVYTLPSVLSGISENYDVSLGGQLQFSVDGTPAIITINTSNFDNSTSVTAQELAMELTSLCEAGNINAFFEDYFDETTNTIKVRLYSQTLGPSGSIQITGGQVQNYLQFNSAITNTQDNSTQYTITVSGDTVKWAWTAGTKPPLSGLIPGYSYVNIYGTEINALNRGSFPITAAVNSSLTDSSGYFQYISTMSFAQTVTLSSSKSVQFFNPVKERVMDQKSFATISQIKPNSSTVYLPASTDMLERTPTTGGSFLTDNIYTLNHTSGTFLPNESIVGSVSLASGWVISGSNLSTSISLITNTTFTTNELITGQESNISCTLNTITSSFDPVVVGPFAFDPTQPEIVNFSLTLGQSIFPNQSLTAIVVSSTQNISQTGFVYVGASLDTFEGPIGYSLAVGDLLIIDASYVFRYYHGSGELLNLTLQKTPTSLLDYEGIVYSAILSDVANTRAFLEKVIQFVYPAGIELNLKIEYPLEGGFISQELIEYIYGDDSDAIQNL